MQQAFAGPLRIKQRARHARPEDARAAPTSSRCSRRSRPSTASPARWRSASRSSPRRRRGVRRRRRADLDGGGGRRRPARAPRARCPGFGDMKVRTLADVLAKRFGVERRRPLVPNAATLGRRRLAAGAPRLPGREARAQGERARRPPDRAPHAHRRRPAGGGHGARARRLHRARRSTRSTSRSTTCGCPTRSRRSSAARSTARPKRGVAVRLAYNLDDDDRVPVPPPPQHGPGARRVAAVPDRGDPGRARPDAPQVRDPRRARPSGRARRTGRPTRGRARRT